MAIAFTPQERNRITDALLTAARHCACTIGLKKTTLETLTQQSGIFKSMFYAFFPSKEHLFLQVYAQWHREIFDDAQAALQQAQAMPPHERAAYTLEHTFTALSQSEMLHNFLEDWPLLERKLPPDEMQAVAQMDMCLVSTLIAQADVRLCVPVEDAIAIVRILLMSLRVHSTVGEPFHRALSLLVRAACAQCIAA